MAQRIRSRDIEQLLTNAGHEQSEFVDDAWDPGFRVTPGGPRLVHVLHDGPGEADGLAAYTEILRATGYHVVADRSMGTRHRLSITRP